MADSYCSTRFKTGDELDEALQAALRAPSCAERAEQAANQCDSLLATTNQKVLALESEVSSLRGSVNEMSKQVADVRTDLGSIDVVLDNIIAIQEALIGGNA